MTGTAPYFLSLPLKIRGSEGRYEIVPLLFVTPVAPLNLRLCHNPENLNIVMLNLFQHLSKSMAYETLKQVQGDKNTVVTQSP